MLPRQIAVVLGTAVALVLVVGFYVLVALAVGIPVNWAMWQIGEALPYWANLTLFLFLTIGGLVLYWICRDL